MTSWCRVRDRRSAAGTHRRAQRPITVSTGCGRVALHRLPDRSVVVFAGEIDVAFRDAPFHRVVAAVASRGAPVHVDCSAVTFFGAEGLRLLDELAAATREHGFAGVVTSPAVERAGRVYPLERYRSVA